MAVGTDTNKALKAFNSRSDLAAYGNNALLLFSLQLRLGITDIHGVAAAALTDHSNDKSCDLVYVDRDSGRIVVGQGYFSQKPDRPAAPADKAADLNQAVTWLLSGDVQTLPLALQSAAKEVRDAIEQDQIRELDLWYTHNLPESTNAGRELDQAAKTADSLVKRYFPDSEVDVTAVELGLAELERMYERTEDSIAVVADFDLVVSGGFEEIGDRWSAYTTSVPATWLRARWQAHKSDMMSPNVRDYLGIVRSEKNINNGIQKTATDTPKRFWIYNNGITVLVHDYSVGEPEPDGTIRLRVSGLGIVNGAQTTGTVSTLDDAQAPSLGQARVLTRFVKCDDADVLSEIIKYNNTQNKIEAADFRSKDVIQERLRKEFEAIPSADYRGARRGGIQDAIKRSPNRLPDSAVAKAIAAFHGDPNLAYNETRRVWESNDVYSRFFNDRLSAQHVLFCYSLQRAVENARKQLSDIPEDARTDVQKRQMGFFRGRGSISLMVAAISASIETFLNQPVVDRFLLVFEGNRAPSEATALWKPIVEVSLSLSDHLLAATDLGLKNAETVKAATKTFGGLIAATAEPNRRQYEAFAGLVRVGA
jgi:hypothetical protein